ncbi:MAG: cofactor-independent phosphoglycerate mutase [Bacillota bacterium]
MKYIVIVGDGMADYPMEQLGNKTALQYAQTPSFDRIAAEGEVGLVKTIPGDLPPGSDTANLSVIGYDPLQYYTGRSPFEAISLGVELEPTDVSFRCNLVTLSEDEPYRSKMMSDYCAGEISTEEAGELIAAVNEKLATEKIEFHSGFNYRHLMVWHGAPDHWELTPPHDISGQAISSYLPAGEESDKLRLMMEESYRILADHPVNRKRIDKGLNPANSIWIWGNGKKPLLPAFKEKYGLNGSVISAVDLVKGIGLFAGLDLIKVEGATGNLDTNYRGKAEAAIKALQGDQDFIYLHVEAPDECSHRFETENKLKAIELIDQEVVKTITDYLEKSGFDYNILMITDHYTPLSLGTHTREPVPFAIYRSSGPNKVQELKFDEASASGTGLFIEEGYRLMDRFIKQA